MYIEFTDVDTCSLKKGESVAHQARINALQIVKQFNAKMFEPTPSAEYEGHYMTYLEMCKKSKSGEKLAKPDEYLPSIRKKEESKRLGSCTICRS